MHWLNISHLKTLSAGCRHRSMSIIRNHLQHRTSTNVPMAFASLIKSKTPSSRLTIFSKPVLPDPLKRPISTNVASASALHLPSQDPPSRPPTLFHANFCNHLQHWISTNATMAFASLPNCQHCSTPIFHNCLQHQMPTNAPIEFVSLPSQDPLSWFQTSLYTNILQLHLPLDVNQCPSVICFTPLQDPL